MAAVAGKLADIPEEDLWSAPEDVLPEIPPMPEVTSLSRARKASPHPRMLPSGPRHASRGQRDMPSAPRPSMELGRASLESAGRPSLASMGPRSSVGSFRFDAPSRLGSPRASIGSTLSLPRDSIQSGTSLQDITERASITSQLSGRASITSQGGSQADVADKLEVIKELFKAQEAKMKAFNDAQVAAQQVRQQEMQQKLKEAKEAIQVQAAKLGAIKESGVQHALPAEVQERARAQQVQEDREAMSRFLMENGFRDVNDERRTLVQTTYPLHVAAERGDIRLIQLLLDEGADPMKRNSQEHTPAEAAENKSRAGSHAEVVDLLQFRQAEAAALQATQSMTLPPRKSLLRMFSFARRNSSNAALAT